MKVPEWQRKLPVKVRPAVEVWAEKPKTVVVPPAKIISREK